ncbi:strictosidine synthase [Variovorax sp. LjRoot290]
MMRWVSGNIDALLGRGDHAIAVPPLDGALQPNVRLDEAQAVLPTGQVDNLVADGQARLVFSDGPLLMGWTPGDAQARMLHSFSSDITAIASLGDGGLAVALSRGGIALRDASGLTRVVERIGDYRPFCPTAIIAAEATTLIVAEGSATHAANDWQRDLMSKGRSGSIWRLEMTALRATCLARALAFPYGLALDASGQVVASESWRHRLIRIVPKGIETVLDDLPGYPARLAPSGQGGHWLSVFAPRTQLVEFVMRERAFRQRMMAETAPAHWVAPALATGRDFREPMQGGAIKTLGIFKPWAPSRSYGLVVRLDGDFVPVESLHSRADGRRHGVTSAAELGGWLYVGSRGAGEIVRADIDIVWGSP